MFFNSYCNFLLKLSWFICRSIHLLSYILLCSPYLSLSWYLLAKWNTYPPSSVWPITLWKQNHQVFTFQCLNNSYSLKECSPGNEVRNIDPIMPTPHRTDGFLLIFIKVEDARNILQLKYKYSIVNESYGNNHKSCNHSFKTFDKTYYYLHNWRGWREVITWLTIGLRPFVVFFRWLRGQDIPDEVQEVVNTLRNGNRSFQLKFPGRDLFPKNLIK